MRVPIGYINTLVSNTICDGDCRESHINQQADMVIAPVDYSKVFAPGYIVCIKFSDGEREIFSEQGTLTHNGYYPEKYNGPLSWAEEIESFIRQ